MPHPPRAARLLSAALVGALAASAASRPARAQFGGARGGRAERGSADSATARTGRDPATINTVDVIVERRAELGLTPEQVGRVTAVKTRRDVAVDTLSARAAALRPPTDPGAWATMSDSDKVAMRDRLRARGATLRAQRDAEARARDEALAALTPEQGARAVEIEDRMRRAAAAAQRFGGAATRGSDAGGGARGGGGRFGTP